MFCIKGYGLKLTKGGFQEQIPALVDKGYTGLPVLTPDINAYVTAVYDIVVGNPVEPAAERIRALGGWETILLSRHDNLVDGNLCHGYSSGFLGAASSALLAQIQATMP